MTTVTPFVHVEPYVRALGEAGAIRFLLAFGGAQVSLSARPMADNAVVSVVGMEGAIALHREFGVRIARVALAKPWIARVWLAEGKSVSEIARTLHTSDKTVRSWLANERAKAIEEAERRRAAKAAEAARQADLIDWIERRG